MCNNNHNIIITLPNTKQCEGCYEFEGEIDVEVFYNYNLNSWLCEKCLEEENN